MEYKGKLYGKVGEMLFPLSNTTDDIDNARDALDLAQAELRAMYNRFGFKNSNVLDIVDKAYEQLKNPS